MVALLVIFRPQVRLDVIFTSKVFGARNAIVLTETWLFFVELLVKQFMGLLGLHVDEHDLIHVSGSGRVVRVSFLAILFVVRSITASSLCCSSHLFLFLFIKVFYTDYKKLIDFT